MAEAGVARPDYAEMGEAELVSRARAGERDAFRQIMARGNQRLFRIARGVVRNDSEAEDVVQEAYARAFTNLSTFRGDASIFTWLTQITLNEARGRLRKRRLNVALDEVEAVQNRGAHVVMFPNAEPTPEAEVSRAQLRRILETAIDDLPEDFRMVFIMRDVDEFNIAETAMALGIREETVKTRLHRARRLLRSALNDRFISTTSEAFVFLGARCERITENVLARLPVALQD